MARTAVLFSLALALTLASLFAAAQERKRMPVVGVLMAISTPDDPIVEALRKGLRDRGYIEGTTIKIEFRTALGRPERLPGLAEELVSLEPDVIFAVATSSINAVRRATTTIPIVIALGGDPVASGLVASLANPGGNLTGLSAMTGDFNAKPLELLKEAIPRLERVAVLWNPDTPLNPIQAKFIDDLKSASSALAIQLHFVRAQTPEELEAAFATAKRERAQAMYINDGPLQYTQRATIVELAAKARLPAIYRTRIFADAGGLMSYGTDWLDQIHSAAGYVDRILQGAKPGDLPIEQPTKLEFVINLRTAKALRLAIPQAVLVRADDLIR